MKIKNRFLLVFIVVTVLTGSVLVLAFDSHRDGMQTDVNNVLGERATTGAELLDNRLQGHTQTVVTTSDSPALRNHGEVDQRQALVRFVEQSAFSGASVTDSDGVKTALVEENETGESEVVGQSFADQEYVQRALAGETFVSDPFVAETGNELIVISTPIRNDDGEIVGTFSASYDLDETSLFDVFGSPSSEQAITVSAGSTTLYTTADRFDESETRTATMETTGWVVTSHYDSAAISQELWQLAIIQLLIGVSIIGTITGFGIWVYQAEIRHTERLHRRIENLKHRNYTDTVEFSGAAEWREIGNALDRLTMALASREQMLLVINRFLRHNLRNELNVVIGYAGALGETAETPEERQQIHRIQRATQRVLATADRVRTTEELIDPPTQGDCRELVGILAEQTDQVRAEYPAVTFDLVAPDAVWVAGGDTLEVALYELLSNVAVHGGDQPHATVSITESPDSVTVSIADTGPGIPPEEAALLSGTTNITPLTHSSGFGLWLVNWIVGRYGGTLEIPDTNEGTKIVLTLPRNKASSERDNADDRNGDHDRNPDCDDDMDNSTEKPN